MIPLTKLQKEIMQEFYKISPVKVVFNNKARKFLWNVVKKGETLENFNLKNLCPALHHQIERSKELVQNIQSAVFSECVYAQTIANMLNLTCFTNAYTNSNFLPNEILNLLKSYSLVPRYIYSNNDKSKILIQAGGFNGVDSALITAIDLNIYTIEFKEPYAKTSEPDLPKYGEDGNIKITEDFILKYPQFEKMLKEHSNLNFFNLMGYNEHNFSPDSINTAVSENYVKKFADVVCTEDKDGYLVMLPCNQISVWANLEGEIRSSGRNHYSVWTPNFLKSTILSKNGIIQNSTVTMPRDSVSQRKERGGNSNVSGYKINGAFFVYKKNCTFYQDKVTFDISKVRQTNPTIAAKVNFKNLKYLEVKKYYFNKI